MKIFTRLILAFSTVALLCAIVGLIGWYGVNQTSHNLHVVGSVHLPEVEGLGMVLEGLNGLKSAERTMINTQITVKDRMHEYDNLGKRWGILQEGWDKFAQVEKDKGEMEGVNKAKAALDNWKSEHEKLVALVKKVRLDDVEATRTLLLARQVDHLNWVRALEKSVITGKTFTGQLDSRLCGLGKWLTAYKTDNPAFAAILDKFSTPHAKLHGYGERINALLATGNRSQAEQILRKEVAPTLEEILSVFNEAGNYVKEQLDILEEARTIGFGSERHAFSAVMAAMGSLSKKTVKDANQLQEEAEKAAGRSKLWALLAVLFGVACAMGFGFFIARMISQPMVKGVKFAEEIARGIFTSRLRLNSQDEIGKFAKALDHMADSLARQVGVANAIANGDLTCKIELSSAEDSLGGALQTMQQSLYDTISQTKLASNEIASGSMQIADSSQVLAQGASEQASSLEEISSAMTEMASQTKMTAENANQARDLSSMARQAAENGNQQMQQMIGAMAEIRAAGQNVANVIKVIDEIAFQTNMLALNAAVEAAHAGQHGKGFAVVAEEVRNLAARSAKAAKETEELIAGSVAKTENGAKIADHTAAALGEIVSGVAQAAELVGGIAEASREQSQGIDQVTQALGQIDQVTQQNSASAEEGAAAAEELSGQAAQLRQLLQRFKLESENWENNGLAKSQQLMLEG